MKKIIWIAVPVMLLLLFIIVGPYFDIALFDSQCRTFSDEICTANPRALNQPRVAYARPTFGCLRDCRVRNFRCSFDTEFSEKCFLCISNCNNEHSPGFNVSSCYAGCRT